ncbi:MAG: cytochrome c [Bacilli bacterium]|nr:cytochrome c [Bacilli bacterium]
MNNKAGCLLISLIIVVTLTACGSSNTAGETIYTPLTASPSASATPASKAAASPALSPQPSAVATVASSPSPVPSPTATVKPQQNAVASPAATAAPLANNTQAEALFKQNCISCHGVDLEGKIGPNLQKVGERLTPEKIINQINKGGSVMPPFSDILKDDEINALAAWLSAKK